MERAARRCGCSLRWTVGRWGTLGTRLGWRPARGENQRVEEKGGARTRGGCGWSEEGMGRGLASRSCRVRRMERSCKQCWASVLELVLVLEVVEARRAGHRCCTSGTGRGKVSLSLPQGMSEHAVEQGRKQRHKVARTMQQPAHVDRTLPPYHQAGAARCICSRRGRTAAKFRVASHSRQTSPRTHPCVGTRCGHRAAWRSVCTVQLPRRPPALGAGNAWCYLVGGGAALAVVVRARRPPSPPFEHPACGGVDGAADRRAAE